MKILMIWIKLLFWNFLIRMDNLVNLEIKNITKIGFVILASIKSVKYLVCVHPAALQMVSVRCTGYNMLIYLIK